MTDRFTRYYTQAQRDVAETYPSKVAQKNVLDTLNRAYDAMRDIGSDAPFDLHQIRDKHHVLFGDKVETLKHLVSMREAVKAAEIVKPVTKADQQRKAVADAQSTPIAKAVEPLRQLAVETAQTRMRDVIAKATERLVAVDWDLDRVVPAPKSSLGTEEYRKLQARRAFYYSFTVSDPARPARRMSDPNHVVINEDRVEDCVRKAGEMAEAQYLEFVAKLVGKVGEHTAATLTGSSVWGESTLTVTLPSGSKEQWHTQMIVNVSKYGKLFNQFPTRKIGG